MSKRRPRVPAAPRAIYFHGGEPGLKTGDRLLPPAVTGRPQRHDTRATRDDRVYLTPSRGFAATWALYNNLEQLSHGTVYEVRAVGPVEDDPECTAAGLPGLMAETAVVVRDVGLTCVCGSTRPLGGCCDHATVTGKVAEIYEAFAAAREPAEEPAAAVMYHGGAPGLRPGDKVLPPSETGAKPQNGTPTWRADRVYVTDVLHTAAMYAAEWEGDGHGTVYQVTPDAPLTQDPAAVPWMSGYVTTSATVVADLGSLCVCGSGKQIPDCCGDDVREQAQWLKLNPDCVERLIVAKTLAALPFFRAVAVDASPAAILSDVHGPAHWEQVASNGLYLGYPNGANLRVVLAFALLHDAFRTNDLSDSEHGYRAAEWAAQNADRLEGVTDLETLVYALHHHADGFTTENPTVAACWDADRIDLVRVGIAPDPRLMSTKAGRSIVPRLPGVKPLSEREWAVLAAASG